MLFNFNGLHAVFVEAIRRHEPTVAFSLVNGQGKFVFLLFIPTDKDGDIKWSSLELFVILGHTQRILNFDLKGNHFHAGDFKIILCDVDKEAIRLELGLENAEQGRFSLVNFLTDLNAAIPTTLPLEDKVGCIQNNKAIISERCGRHIDKADRIYLLGHRPLALPRKPREETLRKLYMLSKDSTAIARLIGNLRRLNWTVAWTDVKPDGDKFSEIWQATVVARK